MRRPAVFFDRDNTLIQCDGYLGDPAEVTLMDGAAQAVARARRLGYAAVVFSNQSGVARGMFGEDAVHAVNARLDELLHEEEAGAVVDRHEFCPYHPQAVVERYRAESEMRKPRPGMIYQAARQLALDVPRSWVVGDAPRDVEAGKAAGCRTILFKPTNIPESPAASAPMTVEPDFVVSSLSEALDAIERNPIRFIDEEDEAEEAVGADAAPSAQEVAAEAADEGSEDPDAAILQQAPPSDADATAEAPSYLPLAGESEPAHVEPLAAADEVTVAPGPTANTLEVEPEPTDSPPPLPHPNRDATAAASSSVEMTAPALEHPSEDRAAALPSEAWIAGSEAVAVDTEAAAMPAAPDPAPPVNSFEEPAGELGQPARAEAAMNVLEPSTEVEPRLPAVSTSGVESGSGSGSSSRRIPAVIAAALAAKAAREGRAPPAVGETPNPRVQPAAPASAQMEMPAMPHLSIPTTEAAAPPETSGASAAADASPVDASSAPPMTEALAEPKPKRSPRKPAEAQRSVVSAEGVPEFSWGDLSRLESLCEQILGELRRQNPEDAVSDFAVSKLLAGIVQVVSLAALFYAYFVRETPALVSVLLLAVVFQVLTISLLIMGKQK